MPDMLVRLKKGKKTYEVMVQEGMVAKYRDGTVTQLDDVIVTPMVFTNSSKGTRASAEQLTESFQTDDMLDVIKHILEKGEAQESAGERKEKLDAKRQEIIMVIQKNYVAADGRPLPLNRIENALVQVKPRIDVDVDAERQVTAMFTKLTAVMAMKKSASELEGTVSVPIRLAGVVSGIVRKHATVLRESYAGQAKYDLSIHSYEQLLSDLAKVTKGEYEFKLVSNPPPGPSGEAGPSSEQADTQREKGKKKKKKK